MSGGAHGGDGAPGRASTPGAVPRNLTPVSNTGVNSTKPSKPLTKQGKALHAALRPPAKLLVSLHYLTATTKDMDIMTAVEIISDYLGHGPEVQSTGLFGYDTAFIWLGGLKVLDCDKRPDMGICLNADGEACEHYGFDQLAYLYQLLCLKATRVDLAADGCRFTPKSLHKLWMLDCVRSVVRTSKNALASRERVRTNRLIESPTGDTFYMGARSSTQMARVYNRRGATRFEMELKKERAQQTMQALCDGANMAGTLGAAIAQFVMFTDKSDENRSRCKVLPFWRRFMRSLGNSGAVVRLTGSPEKTTDRLIDWIENQVAPSLAVYEILMGGSDSYDDVRRRLRKIGLKNAKPRHRAMVATAKAWLGNYDPKRYGLAAGVSYPTLCSR